MYLTLRDFIAALDRAGELKRISGRVSPILEITEIADRVSKMRAPSVGETGTASDPEHADLGGPALLFENIEGVESDIPVAINLFGSYHRLEMALGCHGVGPTPGGFDAIAARIATLTNMAPPRGLADALEKGKTLLPLLRVAPKRVRSGICQEIVKTGDAVNLFEIPMIKCWPLDGDPVSVGWPIPSDQPDTSAGQGRFITLAGMYTIHAGDRDHPKPPSLNIGMYRSQLIDRNHLIMHWHMHHDGAAHWRSWKRLGKRMPIAIVFGGESVLPYAATAPLPPGVSELLMAGFLNHSPIKLVRAKTIPIDVPANAEIVIEGYVSTECGHADFDPWKEHTLGPGAVLEGPFGDHTGFYSLPDRYPLLEATAITHRRNPIYPATIVGTPPQEDYYLGKATERIFLPLLQTLIPDIKDYDLPMFGCFHNCAVVKIRKEYPMQARRVMHAVWGAGQMAWTKIVIVVDDDVNVHQIDDVMREVFANCHFGRDLEIVNGPLDILDHAAPFHGAGHKIGFDATRKIPGEGVNGIPFDAKAADASARVLTTVAEDVKAIEGVHEACLPAFGNGRCLFASIEKSQHQSARPAIERILHSADRTGVRVVFVVDAVVDIGSRDEVLFHWGAGADPGRDLFRIEASPEIIAFDCTAKSPSERGGGEEPIRRYPPRLEMEPSIVERVSSRWRDGYNLD